MEPKRFENNQLKYIFGMISLTFFLIFSTITLYLMPYLLMQFPYRIPDYLLNSILMFETTIHEKIGVNQGLAFKYIFVCFLLISLLFFLIAWFLVNCMENRVHRIKNIPKEYKNIDPEIKRVFYKIFFMVFFGLSVLLSGYFFTIHMIL